MPRLKSTPKPNRSASSADNDNNKNNNVITIDDDNENSESDDSSAVDYPCSDRITSGVISARVTRRRANKARANRRNALLASQQFKQFAVDHQFRTFLSEANFYLTINYLAHSDNNDNNTIPEQSECIIGSFVIEAEDQQLVDNLRKAIDDSSVNNESIFVYCKQSPFAAMVYYECNHTKRGMHSNVRLVSHTVDGNDSDADQQRCIDFAFLDALRASSKLFRLTTSFSSRCVNNDINTNQFVVDVWLQKCAIQRSLFPETGVNYSVLRVMNYYYGYDMPVSDVCEDMQSDIELLYAKIKARQQRDVNANNPLSTSDDDVQHPSLLPELRQYQSDAVKWMLSRERHDKPLRDHQIVIEKVITQTGHQLFYNKYVGCFADNQTGTQYINTDNNDNNGVTSMSRNSGGGILADEMGLGKTIEVLACILCNTKPVNDNSYDHYLAVYDNIYDELEGYCECVCGEISNVDTYKRNSAIYDCRRVRAQSFTANKVCGDSADPDITENELSMSDTDILNTGDSDTETDARMNDENDNSNRNHRHHSKRKRSESLRVKTPERKKKLRKRNHDRDILVQCALCGSYQHPKCVNFDVTKRLPYFCGHCWVSSDLVKPVNSRATLIVSPSTICHQWQEEITKHVNCAQLSVYVYEGVRSKTGFVQPIELADNDIVLTTYETLRSELNFVDLQHSNRFRNPKRFNSTPTPLLAVNWWRICLDEAQMVEGASTQVAKMALKLYATNRWCITGTPVQRSVNDLYGLMMFIGEEPYRRKLYWDSILYRPYCAGDAEPIAAALSQCFWRTRKCDVSDQLGIPEQMASLKRLKFSPVEQHFYMRQHNECQLKFNQKMVSFTDLNIRLNELDKKTVNLLLKPMLSLRQACCHPQAIRGKFIPISKKTLSMEELLESMIKNTQYECEEEHRKLISALNGLAAINIINKEYKESIDTYREALQSIENYKQKDLFRTDKLQQLHTLHNLAEIVEMCGIKQIDKNNQPIANIRGENNNHTTTITTTTITISIDITRTLRDEYLRFEAKLLRDEYLAKGSADVSEKFVQLYATVAGAGETQSNFRMSSQSPWWKSAIDYLSQTLEDDNNLVARVKETLEAASGASRVGPAGSKAAVNAFAAEFSIANHFHVASGLIYILDNKLRELSASRKAVKQVVSALSPMPSDDELNEAVDCHLRPDKDKEGHRATHVGKCKYCRIHELFNKYEMSLFYFSEEVKISEAMCKSDALLEKLRRGTWGDSETEQTLKVVHHCFKTKSHNYADAEHRNIVFDGANHIKLFDALKKEFRAMRAVWMEIFDFIAKIDELNMATIRLRVRYDHEPKPVIPMPYILERYDVSGQSHVLRADQRLAKHNLTKKLSHLYYLNNLSKAESGRKGGQNPELCPICRLSMGQQWSVLQCGHCLCVKCVDVMISGYAIRSFSETSIRCAMCRSLCPLADILYVNSSVPEEEEHTDPIQVVGSWSTKVEEIVRCMLRIKQEEPHAKSLIFSTWTDVLQLISNALLENSVEHCFIKSSYKFAATIDTFKHSDDIKVLLLPINSGAKGLNLIEATHVILAEPTLNKANELQAVGRVHRIGQTRVTYVHRFLVDHTIEDRIDRFYSASAVDAGKDLDVSHVEDSGCVSPTKKKQLAGSSEHAYLTLSEMKNLFDSCCGGSGGGSGGVSER